MNLEIKLKGKRHCLSFIVYRSIYIIQLNRKNVDKAAHCASVCLFSGSIYVATVIS